MTLFGNPIYSGEDARRLARRRMPRMMYDFVAGATGRELAARRNRAAFDNIRLLPRVLNDTKTRVLTQSILGEVKGLPFGVAPMGMCNLAWPGADRMLAAAAARHAIPLGVSTAASTPLEDIYRQSEGQAWFQLYVNHAGDGGDDGDSALRMAERAQAAGYTHLMLTADVPQIARRIRDLKNGFQVPFRMGLRQFGDFALHPRWSIETLMRGVPRLMNYEAPGSGKFVRTAERGAADWAFLDRLRARWRGKLIVKGVLAAQDARRIVRAGADAVYVSNHGGRQLDSAPPSIDRLAAIRVAVGADYPLILDSGIRSGEDVVKALALGANFVMLGRPMLYALGADGARGLAALIDILANEISVVLAQLGLRRVSDISAAVVAGHSGEDASGDDGMADAR